MKRGKQKVESTVEEEIRRIIREELAQFFIAKELKIPDSKPPVPEGFYVYAAPFTLPFPEGTKVTYTTSSNELDFSADPLKDMMEKENSQK